AAAASRPPSCRTHPGAVQPARGARSWLATGCSTRSMPRCFAWDVGWPKPHRAPFDRALSLLEVVPADALFVGDDHRWDIVGAQNAGLRPVLLGSDLPESRRDHLTIPNLAGTTALLAEASL